MIKNLVLAAALAASFAATGCASTEAMTANESVTDREYPTGSSIPRKSKSATGDAAVLDREAAERMRDSQTGGLAPNNSSRPGGM